MLRVRSIFMDNMKAQINRMPTEKKSYLVEGAMTSSFLAGVYSYFHYRMYLRKTFLRSEGHYRMDQECKNCTPWKQMYFTWWRMPREEWTVKHRFMPYYIIGQLDLSREILLPRKKTINGKLVDGFDVVNPLYCYEGGRISMKDSLTNNAEDPLSIDRSAIICVRGWIPAKYRDKRSRP